MFLKVVILLVGFLFLVKGADWFVEGAASIAKKLGIPQLIIGLTIVAMGTSMPEAAVSITAALQKNAILWIGTYKHKELRRPCGIFMLLCYVAYFVYLCMMYRMCVGGIFRNSKNPPNDNC